MNLGDADNMMEHAMKVNTSPNNSATFQHSHSHAVYCGISVYIFNGSFLGPNNSVLLNVIWHYMVFSLYEFPANNYTFITHGLAHASNIHTLLIYGLSP